MKYNHDRALQLLRLGSGIADATFREQQAEAIRHIVEGRGRLLVVQRTGWGKSFVYFIATKLMRERGAGPSLLISPLLSLMRNQLLAAKRMGVRAVTINSANKEEWDDAVSAIHNDAIDILLISPERLANDDFRDNVLTGIAERLSLLIIDEAHCISDWGHDFRPDYRRIERLSKALPENMRWLGTTATANDRVMDDLAQVMGPNLQIMKGDLHRPSLFLQTMTMPTQAERLAWLADHLPTIPGNGIIYTLTIRDANRVSDWLRQQGINVHPYTSKSENREELEQALLDNEIKALISTTALGMGFDKPDLAFVIHYQRPGSVVAYYQQVGRAGRAIDTAYGVLLTGKEDTEIVEYFITSAFPTRDNVRQVLGALEYNPAGLSIPQLLQLVNLSKSRMDQTIKLLSLESPAPIVKQGSKWQLTAARLSAEFWNRVERLTSLRCEENEQMQIYSDLNSGHMEFLIKALNGNSEPVRSANITPLSGHIRPETVTQAIEFLRRALLPIEPRMKWPSSGGLPLYGMNGMIPEDSRPEIGRALCLWGDPGWGEMVRAGKQVHFRFSEDLVEGALRLIREWNPVPSPEWVTCVPSLQHSNLVPDFARRLARRLGVPFVNVLMKTEDRPPQKDMQNSVQQARNVDGSLKVVEEQMRTGPVLLVDDMVDSRWTLTIASWLLRSNGCAKVWPFVLADTGNG